MATKNSPGKKSGSGRRYGKKAQEKVQEELHEMKEGKLRSGRSGKKVTNPKQAIAIGLSEARAEGDKVPRRQRNRAALKSRRPRSPQSKRALAKGAQKAPPVRSRRAAGARRNPPDRFAAGLLLKLSAPAHGLRGLALRSLRFTREDGCLGGLASFCVPVHP